MRITFIPYLLFFLLSIQADVVYAQDEVAKLISQATEALSKGDNEKAREIIDKALQLDPQNPLAKALESIIPPKESSSLKELRTFSGHDSPVSSISFSPDGKTIASADWHGTVKIWETETGKEVRTLDHRVAVYSVHFSPDGGKLASGGEGTPRIWDVKKGEEIRGFEGHGDDVHPPTVSSVRFSPDGRILATGSHDTGLSNSGMSQQVNCFAR